MNGVSIFTKIRQVAVVTRNTRRSVEKFADLLGTGVWQYYNFGPKNCMDMELHGKSAEYSMALAVCDIGNVQFEFCQPLDDRSLYAKFLKERGEGPQHIAYALDREYEEAIEYFKSKGMTVNSTGNWHGCCKFNYLTGVENFKHTPEFHKQDLVEVAKYLPDGEYPEKGLDFRGKPVLEAITKVGLVVHDLEETVGFYENEFQIGPWERLEYNNQSVENMKEYGRPAEGSHLFAQGVRPYHPPVPGQVPLLHVRHGPGQAPRRGRGHVPRARRGGGTVPPRRRGRVQGGVVHAGGPSGGPVARGA